MNAEDRLLRGWSRHGARTAIFGERGDVISFAELDERARAWALAFRGADLRPGDRVAAVLEPSVEAIAAMLGVLRAGGAWVPINTRYRDAERGHVLADSGARLVLVDAGLETVGTDHEPGEATRHACLADGPAGIGDLAAAREPAEPDAAACLLVYTSGTTGPSKGVQLAPEAIVEGIGALVDAWRFGPTDVLSLSLPLYHVHGLCIGVLGALLSGVGIRLHARFDPAKVLADFGATPAATVFMGVPTMYVALLEHLAKAPPAAAPLREARLFTAGSAALSPDVLARFEAATGHRILERYGMTETLISLSNPYDGPRRAGAVGGPVPGYAIRIVDEKGQDIERGDSGELLVRGPGLMRGYWRRPDATSAAFDAGWFRTGDMARFDDDGVVRIVGRISTDIIKSGGFKIAAGEIEEVLRAHPDVRDAAVVGLPDPRWGEQVVAAVELREGATLGEASAELAAFVADRLADYKKPRRVIVLDALPRNALGKVVKRELQQRFAGG